MKKTLIILSVFSFAFSGASLYVCGHTDDGAGNATFDICMNSDEAVAGVQFSFESASKSKLCWFPKVLTLIILLLASCKNSLFPSL